MKQNSFAFGIAIFVIALVAVYVGSYLLLTERSPTLSLPSGYAHADRDCRYEWMTTVYRPLAEVETFVTGTGITLTHGFQFKLM